jgi:hypothetical protein
VDEKVSLEFIARQLDRVLKDQAAMREDITVMAAMMRRFDGTLDGLLHEVRAEHARHSRVDQRLRDLEATREP